MFLVVAGFSVFGSLGSYLSFAVTLNALLAELHAQLPEFPQTTYTDTGLAEPVGMIIITLSGLVLGLTVWWTVNRIRARKISFWVPLVGYVIMSAIVFAGEITCLLSDPAFVDAFLTATRALQTVTPSVTPSATPVPTGPIA